MGRGSGQGRAGNRKLGKQVGAIYGETMLGKRRRDRLGAERPPLMAFAKLEPYRKPKPEAPAQEPDGPTHPAVPNPHHEDKR